MRSVPMAAKGISIWLPKSGVMVCLKPGEDLTDEELEALEEFFLLIKERLHGDQADSSPGEPESG